MKIWLKTLSQDTILQNHLLEIYKTMIFLTLVFYGQKMEKSYGIKQKDLTNNHVISGSAYQTRNVGYVYYEKGLIVITDPRPKYQNCFLGNGNFNYTQKGFEFTYKSSKKIEQQSFLCEIGRSEFNVSQNNTLRLGDNEYSNDLIPFVTGSDFRPYITSIGLYNDTGDLLAIAKMGSPLKKRQDVDVTVDVRLDFEQL